MNLKPEQAAARLDRPSPDIRLYLLHGPDEGGAAALAARLARGVGADAERVDIEAGTLRSQPGLLADEAASQSLFGSPRHIRVGPAGEEVMGAVELLLAAPRAGNPVAILAPNVRKTGKLLKLVGDARNAIAIGCYVPSSSDAQRIAMTMAREAGLRLTGDAAHRLAEASGGDRAILEREIEKLALFLDAAFDRPRDADGAAIEAVGAVLPEDEVGEIVAAMVDGDAGGAGRDAADITAVPMLRAAVRRLLTLAEMAADIEAGASERDVLKRHRVHFTAEEATARALRQWTPAMLARAIDRLKDAERRGMSGGGLGEVLAAAEAVTVARAGARHRGR